MGGEGSPLQAMTGVDWVLDDEAWLEPIATGLDCRDERRLWPWRKRQLAECAAGAVTRSNYIATS